MRPAVSHNSSYALAPDVNPLGYVVKRTDRAFVASHDTGHDEAAADLHLIVMTEKDDRTSLILVVEDVEETRDGIERLLRADGYRVDAARDEEDAVVRARRAHPNLILVSLGGRAIEVVATATRIRERAQLRANVPIVIFCVPVLLEGSVLEIEGNVHLTRPDNFDQLRGLMRRLLHQLPATG